MIRVAGLLWCVLFSVHLLASDSAPGQRELFQGREVLPPNDRLHSQTQRNISVTTAVPSAEEATEIFGANLYARNVQPVWVQVENRSAQTLFLTPMGLDRHYYTPRESAHRSESNNPLMAVNRDFETRGLVQLAIEPNSVQSGYIFSRVDEGTKSFNVDIMGDGSPYTFTFFVPVPGLKIDHHEVDIKGMYAEAEIRHLDLPELIDTLEQMPCCVRDSKGEDKGDPLNLVFIGDIQDMYYSFLRAGWDETETITRSSLWKTAVSAMTGGRYRYSPVSALYVYGRPQDIAMQRARGSIHERNHLRVWLTPLRHEGKPVWIGQISRDIGVHFTWRTITTHKIDPAVDETRDFLLEDLAYAQAVAKYGYVGGVGAAGYDEPRGNLTGDPYFTDGRRIVVWVADNATSISDIEVLRLKAVGNAQR